MHINYIFRSAIFIVFSGMLSMSYADEASTGNVAHWLDLFYKTVDWIWTYQIAEVEGDVVSIGSVVLAILLAVIGFVVSRYMARVISRVLIRRLNCDEGASAAIRTITFYILLCSFTLLALRAVNFPLAVFTVLGGALAIGIGFGSQNVMNNFISGLILMIERPVRINDVVEIEGNHGVIENMGARSTQIRSMDGRHIVVPNSFLLQNNLINWTLSDDLMRTKVSVGVAYGSDTALVEKCLVQSVSDEPEVHMDPPPTVIFESFGDNSLNFDVFFWVHARSPMAVRKVASRLRFTIDRIFRENNIVIAFPQRDVHLDITQPLNINLLNDATKRF